MKSLQSIKFADRRLPKITLKFSNVDEINLLFSSDSDREEFRMAILSVMVFITKLNYNFIDKSWRI